MTISQPADKSHFILPDLGEGVHEAELIKWCVRVGDDVAEHQTLAEMETDKALVEVPSPWSGTIASLHGEPGETLLVGNKLVSYATSGSESPVVDDATPNTGCVVGAVESDMAMPKSFARTPDPTTGKPMATPAVRRLARDLDVNLQSVAPTGRGGRVTASDVEAMAHSVTASPPNLAPESPEPTAPLATRVSVPQEGVAERIPFRGIRRKIAESLCHSLKTAAHFQVVDEADVTELDKRRVSLSEMIGRKMSLLPFVMTGVCRGLKKHPILNATVDDFVDEILVHSVINIGCAVDTDQGLMVAVVKNADTLSPVQLADEVARLAGGCRDRSVKPEELSGGTFTISNVGSCGGMFTTPIINYPEVAILGVGRAKERVLTKDGTFYAGKVLPLSLSCDHRVVDGAEGARFLRTVIDLLENPDELLPRI